VTPLGFVHALVDDLSTLLLPEPVHGQLGEIIVPCAGTYVSILNQTEVELGANCDTVLLADVAVVAARDCANVSNDDGTTNWDAQDAVSLLLDRDGTVLWEWAEKQRADAWYRQGTPTITYMTLGAIAMTTLGVLLPIP
jgi:hypothetical protein